MDSELVEQKGFDLEETAITVWKTEAGEFNTSKEGRIEGIRLSQFTTKRKVGFDFSIF